MLILECKSVGVSLSAPALRDASLLASLDNLIGKRSTVTRWQLAALLVRNGRITRNLSHVDRSLPTELYSIETDAGFYKEVAALRVNLR